MDTSKFNELLAEAKKKAKTYIKDDLRETGEDAYYFVLRNAKRARDAVRNANSNVKNGFPYYAAWNIGDYLLIRAANVCGYLSEQSYYDMDMDYFRHLRECEDIFNAYSLSKELGLSLHVNDIGKKSDEKSEKTLGHDVFMDAWMWYGEHVMDPQNFIAPLAMKKTPKTMLSNVLLKTSLGFDANDFHKSFGAEEAKRISKMLKKMAQDIHGYTEGYASKPGLKERGDDWENRQSIAVSFMVDSLSSDEYNETLEDGCIRPRTRKEIGVDFCAWVEDILYASEILRLWSEWESDTKDVDSYDEVGAIHTLSPRAYMEILDKDAADETTRDLNEKFAKTWKWIGENIWGLWD